jgi:hypothetical protein
MKSSMNLRIFLFVISLVFVIFSACKKDENTAIAAATEEEAVEVVQNTMSSESGGLTEQIETSAAIVAPYSTTRNDICGLVFDTAIILTNTLGSQITYEYNFGWDWEINCNQWQIPESVTFSYNMNGWYNGPDMSAQDSADQSFQLSGLDLSQDYLTYNGSYQREGLYQSKIGGQRSLTGKIAIETINVKVNKTSYKIESGTANITVFIETSDGRTFSFAGTIIFNGNDIATLAFEEEYEIEL